MVGWYCQSSLCFNNYTTRNSFGDKIKYYRLPRDPDLQIYQRVLHTTNMDWKNGIICAEHFSSGVREDTTRLPDIPVPPSQIAKIETRLQNARKVMSQYKNPSEKQKKALTKAKRKYDLAMSLRDKSFEVTERRTVTRTSTPVQKKTREPSKIQYKKKLDMSNTSVVGLEQELSDAKIEIETLKKQIVELISQKEELESKLSSTCSTLTSEVERKFQHVNICKVPSKFHYLSGFSREQFQVIFECAKPYLHIIPYPDCTNLGERSIDYETELLSVLTVCRHGLHQGVMAFMLERSASTMQRIFVGWVLFLSTLLSKVDLKAESGFIVKKMPKVFIETGHGLTELVGDATEFAFDSSSNFELNTLMFSHYKNKVTGKALIGISPHGSALLVSDIYPGSISDSEITEKSGALIHVKEGM